MLHRVFVSRLSVILFSLFFIVLLSNGVASAHTARPASGDGIFPANDSCVTSNSHLLLAQVPLGNMGTAQFYESQACGVVWATWFTNLAYHSYNITVKIQRFIKWPNTEYAYYASPPMNVHCDGYEAGMPSGSQIQGDVWVQNSVGSQYHAQLGPFGF